MWGEEGQPGNMSFEGALIAGEMHGAGSLTWMRRNGEVQAVTAEGTWSDGELLPGGTYRYALGGAAADGTASQLTA